MRKLGFDPFAEHNDQWREIFRSGTFESLPGLIPRAILLFKLSVESDDSALLRDVEAFYRSRGWVAEIEMAHWLVDVARARQGDSPEDVVDTFRQCVDVLLPAGLHARFAGWGPLPRGDFVIERHAKLILEPDR